MAALVTVAELKEHVETDLPTAALQRLIDDADGEIVAKYGTHAGSVTYRTSCTDGAFIFLPRPAISVSSVKEVASDQTETTLAADDYRLWFNGWAVKRITGGTYPRSTWTYETEIAFTPADETKQRARVTIDLVNLALSYKGAAKSTSDGDHSEGQASDAGAYEVERQRILQTLSARRVA